MMSSDQSKAVLSVCDDGDDQSNDDVPASPVTSRSKRIRPSPSSSSSSSSNVKKRKKSPSDQKKQPGRRGRPKKEQSKISEDDVSEVEVVETQTRLNNNNGKASVPTNKDLQELLDTKIFDKDEDKVVIALHELGCHCTGEFGKENAAWILQRHGVEKMLSTILRFPLNPEIKQFVFQALQNMCSTFVDSIDEEIRDSQVIPKYVIPALDMEEGEDSEAMKESAVGLLMNCCCLQANSKSLLENGGVERVVKSIEEYPGNSNIRDWGIATLKLVCEKVADVDYAHDRTRQCSVAKALLNAYNVIVDKGKYKIGEMRDIWKSFYPFVNHAVTVNAN